MVNGRNDRVRTCDIVLPKHARYQLRYIPVKIKKGLMSQSLGAPAENRTPDTLIKSFPRRPEELGLVEPWL